MTETDDDTPYDAEREARLDVMREKFDPETVSRTLVLAGLTQLVHRYLQLLVVEMLQGTYGWVPGKWDPDKRGSKGTWTDLKRHGDYQREVSSKSDFNKSRDWLIAAGAITEDDAAVLTTLHQHRTNIVHELDDFLINPSRQPDTRAINSAIRVFRTLDRYWAGRAVASGKFGTDEVPLDEVKSMQGVVLEHVIAVVNHKFPEREPEC